ncbi:unnamed protein product, partial [Iphiclides podalirius]
MKSAPKVVSSALRPSEDLTILIPREYACTPRRGRDAPGRVDVCAVYKAKLDRPHFTAGLDRTVQAEAILADAESPRCGSEAALCAMFSGLL